MAGNERPFMSFNEEAAREELERTQRALEESRQRRREASEAFDTFLRSFHKKPADTQPPPSDEPPTRPPVSPEPVMRAPEGADAVMRAPLPSEPVTRRVAAEPPFPAPASSEPVTRAPSPAPAAPEHPAVSPQAVDKGPDDLEEWLAHFEAAEQESEPAMSALPHSEPAVIEVPDEVLVIPELPPVETPTPAASNAGGSSEPIVVAPAIPAALRSEPPRQRSPRRLPRMAGVAILVGGAAILAWRVRAPGSSSVPPAAGNPPAVQAPAPAAQSAANPQAAAAGTGLQAELTTLRPVWVRVVVDGEKRIERELAAGQKIPLSARETIVVRAGDAGALRVTVAGKDQGPLGPDGAVATRTFSQPRR